MDPRFDPPSSPAAPVDDERLAHPERRRPGWREFRRSYPGILATMSLAVLLFLAMDAWLVYKRFRYTNEIQRLRATMSDVERKRADAVLANDENRFRIMIALIRRQAESDKQLHLAISVDTAVMYLEREGAILRESPIQVGPEQRVGSPPDTVHMAPPRGARTVERVLGPNDSWDVPAWVYTSRGLLPPEDRTVSGALGPAAIILNGGTVIYSMPTKGPLNDSSYVLPGSVRATAADLKAITPNLSPGTTVYFY